MPALAEAWSERYARVANGLFGDAAARHAARNPRLRASLEQAHSGDLPATFVAVAWLSSLLAFVGSVAVVALLVSVSRAVAGALPPAPVALVLALLPPLAGAGVFVGLLVYPDYRAGERRRLIEADLPYAVNYVAAMSSAGVVPAAIVRDVARQPTYGEASREFAWMARDLDLLGVDLVSAMNRAIARSPSPRFQDFLQGAKTTMLSGGDLKSYFASKAEQYMAENRRHQKEFLEGLGILAESYVTVIIAGPLFVLVLLSIMALIGSSAAAAEVFLFALVFLLLPVCHIAFTWIVKNMKPGV